MVNDVRGFHVKAYTYEILRVTRATLRPFRGAGAWRASWKSDVNRNEEWEITRVCRRESGLSWWLLKLSQIRKKYGDVARPWPTGFDCLRDIFLFWLYVHHRCTPHLTMYVCMYGVNSLGYWKNVQVNEAANTTPLFRSRILFCYHKAHHQHPGSDSSRSSTSPDSKY